MESRQPIRDHFSNIAKQWWWPRLVVAMGQMRCHRILEIGCRQSQHECKIDRRNQRCLRRFCLSSCKEEVTN